MKLQTRTVVGTALGAAVVAALALTSRAFADPVPNCHDQNADCVTGDINSANGAMEGRNITIHHINNTTLTIKATGTVTIQEKIDQHSNVTITAASVYIGQKIDQHSESHITALGSVHIGEKIDQHSQAWITSENGTILIGQNVDAESYADLWAKNGAITMGEPVNGNSTVEFEAKTGSNIRTAAGRSAPKAHAR